MRKLLLPIMLMYVLAFSTYAKDIKDVKFAVVNVEKVILSSKEGKKFKKEMEDKLSYYQKQLEELKKRYEEIQKQLKSPVLSEEGKKKKEEEKKKLEEKVRNIQMQATQELAKMKQKAEKEMIEKVKEVVAKYAKKHSIDIVFIKSLMAGVVYAKPNLDITDQIIKEINK